MKNVTITKPTLSVLINDRLARIGAASIPTSARDIIEADIIPVVAALIARRLTAPLVGRAVARSLAAPAAIHQEGCKGGGTTPLPSSDSVLKAQDHVTGPAKGVAKTPATDPRQLPLPFPEGLA